METHGRPAEVARFNFLANLNRHLSGVLGAGNRLAWETRVLPAFVAAEGRPPRDRFEVRRAMNRDPYHRFWSALRRNSMEMRQQNGRSMVLRQAAALAARAEALNAGQVYVVLNRLEKADLVTSERVGQADRPGLGDRVGLPGALL